MDTGRSSLRRGWRVTAAVIPAAFVALFFAFPLVAILERGLTSGGGLSLPRGTAELLWFTTWQAAASTVLTLVAGLPLAWAIGRFRFRGRSLARALVHGPSVVLLDEPTTGLDHRGVTRLLEVVQDELDGGAIVVVVAHDDETFAALQGRKIGMDRGRIVEPD